MNMHIQYIAGIIFLNNQFLVSGDSLLLEGPPTKLIREREQGPNISLILQYISRVILFTFQAFRQDIKVRLQLASQLGHFLVQLQECHATLMLVMNELESQLHSFYEYNGILSEITKNMIAGDKLTSFVWLHALLDIMSQIWIIARVKCICIIACCHTHPSTLWPLSTSELEIKTESTFVIQMR